MTPESLVRDTHDLFSFPEAALRINELIDHQATTIEDLAEVILTDPALAARLLRLVNSALYARQTPIDTVARAIPMIGFGALRNLVMATAAVEVFQDLPPERINMEQFWFHGVACGVAARELNEQLKLKGGEQLFLAGLLHGIGKLVFFSRCPQDYLSVLELIDREGLAPAAAEEAIFGFDYATLGGELLHAWNFPDRIWQAVAHHLHPEGAEQYHQEAETIHAAEIIAGVVQANRGQSNETAPPPSQAMEEITSRLGLDQEQVTALPLNISLQVMDVFEILVPGASVIW
ncbi:HDOD domain-containing protein [Thiorhodovibrio frisius]|uniref:Putative signal transduction protein n=1 Tax=Thiorhodovibrio frisius TaxID=631362 RepID=H8Z2L8_9GAMM|nr:HDOD domain-containing protein [Thiorhodovibrio frisius]EIC22711.1 putative signal transduction protein [Thiorhodovibrio frisius]WPL22467.1 HDOD domain protein [Thiorhodovibrio frisius]